MTNDVDRNSEVDPELSAMYRSAADERAPAELNRRVLKEAVRAAKSNNAGAWRAAWYRPVAFAATVGLTVALVFQLTDTDPSLPPTGHESPAGGPRVAPASGSPFEETARAAEEQLRDAATRASASMTTPSSVSGAAVEPGTDGTLAESLLPDDERCSDDERMETASWWACIQELERQGLTRAAELELQALLKTFPGFSVPE